MQANSTTNTPSEHLCECGTCGLPTKIAIKSIPRLGWIEGQPLRFINGHNMFRPVTLRFWEKVNKDGPIPEHQPELGPCWEWTGATTVRCCPTFVCTPPL